MQVSCKLLNNLINLNHITLEELEYILALRGFEIEDITENIEDKDKIINFNITTNRRELSNITRIAEEISIILNIPLQIKTNTINISKYIQPSNYNLNANSSNIFKYVIIHHLKSIENQIFPEGIKTYINTITDNLLHNIQKYIKIKWEQDLYYISSSHNYINLDDLKLINNTNIFQIYTKNNNKLLFELHTNQISNHVYKDLNVDNSKSIIFIMPLYNYKYQQYNNIDYFFQAYEETIKLLTTYGQYIVSKAYKCNYTVQYNTKTLYLNKHYILNILGPIANYKLQYLNTKKIFFILKQLHFKPKYYNKTFQITIPPHRAHDLTRKIDIVEEIARIYSFDQFINKIPTVKHKGKISKITKSIQKIRSILCHAGFKEVINSSLRPTNNKIMNSRNNIFLYNPMTEEQKLLRSNLLDNLINNYSYHIKHNNQSLEIFEIGKIFYEQSDRIREELHLSGLIYNFHFIRQDWTKITYNLNWFHAKGILEDLLDKLGATYYWNLIYTNKSINSNNSLNYHKQLGIYSKINNDLIGILAQVKSKFNKNIQENHQIYIFDFALKKLIKNISTKKTINYIITPYSLYPSVTRDISIKVKDKNSLINLTHSIQQKYKHLIESIDLINIYDNPKLKVKSICLRITYKALNRTLNNTDIQNIDKNLKYIIQQYI